MNTAGPHAVPVTLAAMEGHPRWVAWQTEDRVDRPGKPTKVPYGPRGKEAKANYPDTWGTRAAVRTIADKLPMPYGSGGTGIQLGDLGNGLAIGGVDLDTCIDAGGAIAPWGLEVIERFDSYTEKSPSATGCKVYFLYDTVDLPFIRAHLGTAKHGKQFKRAGGDHPPAIELYLSNRYFAVTDDPLGGTPPELRRVPIETMLWLLTKAGPAFLDLARAKQCAADDEQQAGTEGPTQRIADAAKRHPPLAARWGGDWTGLTDSSRSGKAMALGAALKAAGFTFADMCAALLHHPDTAEWARDKGEFAGQREMRRIWDAAEGKTPAAAPPAPALGILTRSRQPAVLLPLHIFGPFWSDWIEQAALGANAPPDYVAIPLLATASALIGNSRWMQGWVGWNEPPVLWFGSVGDPSSGKTSGAAPVMRDVLPPIEQHMARDYAANLKAWEEQATVAQAFLRQWEKAVAAAAEKGEGVPKKPKEAEIPPKPIRPRARVDNATIEKLASMLEGLPKGLLFSRDELAGWLLNFGRYSNGGTDRPFWLEAYVGGSHTVDRVKNPEPVYVPRLSVAIFGTIQPDRLAEVLDGADDGLTSRFLWCWPEPRPFRRPVAIADIQGAITALIRLADLQMVQDSNGQLQPSYASLDEAGKAIIEAFGLEMQQREANAHGLMKSAFGKARGQALRLSLVLEWLWWCPTAATEPANVTAEAMQAAVDLMNGYFLPMAHRVLGDASIPQEERRARTLAQWIAKNRPEAINITTIRDGARLDGLRETADVKAACQYLAEAGWLLAPAAPPARGRPRGDYQVNPALWELLS